MKQEEKQKICPICQGKKILEGICECNMEWRGTQGDNDWEDCQCTPEVECPSCHGEGVIEPVT